MVYFSNLAPVNNGSIRRILLKHMYNHGVMMIYAPDDLSDKGTNGRKNCLLFLNLSNQIDICVGI